MTGESKPEFPLPLLLLSHLRQAGTWTKVSSSIKMQRNTIKGEKVLHACTVGTVMSNKIQNDQAPTATTEVFGSKSKVVSIS